MISWNVRLIFFFISIDSMMMDIPIRLMTYNVMRGRYSCYRDQLISNEDFRRSIRIGKISSRADFVRTNLATIADHIRQYQPDILALQEIQESPASTSMTDEISTATYLAQQLDMTFTFSPTLFDSEVQMQYGTAVLVNHHRFRLLAVEILSFPLGLEPRNSPCLTVQSRLTNLTFRACSIHFDHHPTDNRIRLEQAKTLIQWLSKGFFYPTVLLGDFNANRTSATLASLYESFFDDSSRENSLPTFSDCGQSLTDKIDYILFDRKSSWTIKSFIHGSKMTQLYSSIGWSMLSDHVPLFTEAILSV